MTGGHRVRGRRRRARRAGRAGGRGGRPPGARPNGCARAALAVAGVRGFGDPSIAVPTSSASVSTGVEAEPVLLGLDQAGVAVHSGSSCSSETLEPSPVLEAMGVDAERSLRLSVGWSTTDADIEAFDAAFAGVVDELRALRS